MWLGHYRQRVVYFISLLQHNTICHKESQFQAKAKHSKMTPYHVNHYMKFKNQQQCCINGLDCCNVLWQNSILKETKASTRIYIFLGKKKELQEVQ